MHFFWGKRTIAHLCDKLFTGKHSTAVTPSPMWDPYCPPKPSSVEHVSGSPGSLGSQSRCRGMANALEPSDRLTCPKRIDHFNPFHLWVFLLLAKIPQGDHLFSSALGSVRPRDPGCNFPSVLGFNEKSGEGVAVVTHLWTARPTTCPRGCSLFSAASGLGRLLSDLRSCIVWLRHLLSPNPSSCPVVPTFFILCFGKGSPLKSTKNGCPCIVSHGNPLGI